MVYSSKNMSSCEAVESEEPEQQDARLRQHWARKARRRSSDGKVFVGDSLFLRDNSKVIAMMSKNGTYVIYSLVQFISCFSLR